MNAKRLFVNVDQRAWFGASSRAKREGIERQRNYLKNKNEFFIALFGYSHNEGLCLNFPKGSSGNNII
jgi:hypothetical protein